MHFYVFKVAVAIASLSVNVSDQICTQPDQTLFFQIYMDEPPGVLRVSENQIFFLQIKVLSSCPFGSQNIQNSVLGLSYFPFIFLCAISHQQRDWVGESEKVLMYYRMVPYASCWHILAKGKGHSGFTSFVLLQHVFRLCSCRMYTITKFDCRAFNSVF